MLSGYSTRLILVASVMQSLKSQQENYEGRCLDERLPWKTLILMWKQGFLLHGNESVGMEQDVGRLDAD